MTEPENADDSLAWDKLVKGAGSFARGVEKLSKIKHRSIDVGATAKTEVWRKDKVRLFHYETPEGVEVKTGPVLVVYGLVGRYTMADLQEDRSLIRNLLLRGVDLYLVDWGHPTRADRYLTMDDYICGYLDDCVEQVCIANSVDAITLLGICEGGTFCACYGALNPHSVKNLIVTITPIDFHGDKRDSDISHGFINSWTRSLGDEDIDALLEAEGNLTGEFMSAVFLLMTPMRNLTKYNLGLLDVIDDDAKLMNFLRMEKWLADRPNHPAAAGRQWLIDLYKENQLVRGEFRLEGEPVDLARLSMPILNIYALQDHIIPPPCATGLGEHAGSDDYQELALPGGHVGVYVSSKSQGIVGDGVFNWLIERQ